MHWRPFRMRAHLRVVVSQWLHLGSTTRKFAFCGLISQSIGLSFNCDLVRTFTDLKSAFWIHYCIDNFISYISTSDGFQLQNIIIVIAAFLRPLLDIFLSIYIHFKGLWAFCIFTISSIHLVRGCPTLRSPISNRQFHPMAHPKPSPVLIPVKVSVRLSFPALQ